MLTAARLRYQYREIFQVDVQANTPYKCELTGSRRRTYALFSITEAAAAAATASKHCGITAVVHSVCVSRRVVCAVRIACFGLLCQLRLRIRAYTHRIALCALLRQSTVYDGTKLSASAAAATAKPMPKPNGKQKCWCKISRVGCTYWQEQKQWTVASEEKVSTNNSSLNIQTRWLRCDFELSKFCVSFPFTKKTKTMHLLVGIHPFPLAFAPLPLFLYPLHAPVNRRHNGTAEKGTHEKL